jgi:diadenylate cyclase
MINLPVDILFYKPILEILILWFAIYHVMLFFAGTRAIQVLRGMIIIAFAFLLFQKLNLQVLDWLMVKLFGISIISVLIIFHPEIRQGLARLGQRNHFGIALRDEELTHMLQEVSRAAENLSKQKIGALIAIEKNDPLFGYRQSGVTIDAVVSADLIEAIFTPNNPLHDGGLVIQNARLSSAGCLFPLAQNQELSRIFGTRHRAALGLSEETDAIIIIISEERQDISLAYRSRLEKDLSREELVSKIKEILKNKKEHA